MEFINRLLPAKKRLPVANNGLIGEVKRAAGSGDLAQAPLARLGEHVALLSYTSQHTSHALQLSLVWRTDSILNTDYTVFVHLLDAQGRILAQQDAPPVDGRYPTHAWEPTEMVTDLHTIPIDAATLARLDQMVVGMYTPNDGARLPNALGGDTIVIRP